LEADVNDLVKLALAVGGLGLVGHVLSKGSQGGLGDVFLDRQEQLLDAVSALRRHGVDMETRNRLTKLVEQAYREAIRQGARSVDAQSKAEWAVTKDEIRRAWDKQT
jgi:hypothetical protein